MFQIDVVELFKGNIWYTLKLKAKVGTAFDNISKNSNRFIINMVITKVILSMTDPIVAPKPDIKFEVSAFCVIRTTHP